MATEGSPPAGSPPAGSPPAEPSTSTETEIASTAEAPVLPGIYTDPNFVLGDTSATWRYGRPPDYSKTRRLFAETKSQNHEANSLPQLVENLVKNWEIEASFKTKLEDWQTVNPSKYTFSMNGGTPQKGEHMLKVGSYNSIISPNEYYSPEYSDFASTHKTFKRMMPFFAWEVLEVYSGPPKVAFRWRHWGQMKNDYVGFNNRAEKVTAKAHGGWIDIQGITVADLDEDMKIVHLETWFDPMDMFRQIAPKGIVNKQPMSIKIPVAASPEESISDIVPEAAASPALPPHVHEDDKSFGDHEPSGPLLPHEFSQENREENSIQEDNSELVQETMTDGDSCAVEGGPPLVHHESTGSLLFHESDQASVTLDDIPESDVEFMDAREHPLSDAEDNQDITEKNAEPASKETPNAPEFVETEINPDQSKDETKIDSPQLDDSTSKTQSAETETPDVSTEEISAGVTEAQIKPEKGEAVAMCNESVETIMTHEEMSRMTPAECPFFNRE